MKLAFFSILLALAAPQVSYASCADLFRLPREGVTPRLVVDKTVRFVTMGFWGKPRVLQGIRTKSVWWGPHSLKNVFTQFLGVFVGGAPLYGESFFGHPLGKVSVAATHVSVHFTITPELGRRVVSSATLSSLRDRFPGLEIFTSANEMSSFEKFDPQARDLSHIVHISYSNSTRASKGLEDLPFPELKAAVREITTTLLDQ